MNRVPCLALPTALALVASWAAAPSSARACGGFECMPDRFLPLAGSVPANLPGLYWDPGASWDPDAGDRVATTPGALTFRCTGAPGSTRDVPFHADAAADVRPRTIVPDAALNAGETCVVTTRFEPCLVEDFTGEPVEGLSGRTEFSVSPPVPLPSTFGTLRADAARLRPVTLSEDASCDTQLTRCGVAIDAVLDAGSEPWAELLVFETLVDGQPWVPARAANLPNVQGGSYVGRGVDLVFEQAGSDARGVAGGAHTVVMRATLPGTELVLDSEPLEIVLDCAGEPEPDAGDGMPGVDASTATDGGREDGGTPGARAGGCSGCSSVGLGPSASGLWWLVPGVCWLAARHTRRRRAS